VTRTGGTLVRRFVIGADLDNLSDSYMRIGLGLVDNLIVVNKRYLATTLSLPEYQEVRNITRPCSRRKLLDNETPTVAVIPPSLLGAVD
jgi:hypothetical protein